MGKGKTVVTWEGGQGTGVGSGKRERIEGNNGNVTCKSRREEGLQGGEGTGRKGAAGVHI